MQEIILRGSPARSDKREAGPQRHVRRRLVNYRCSNQRVVMTHARGFFRHARRRAIVNGRATPTRQALKITIAIVLYGRPSVRPSIRVGSLTVAR